MTAMTAFWGGLVPAYMIAVTIGMIMLAEHGMSHVQVGVILWEAAMLVPWILVICRQRRTQHKQEGER